MDAYPDCHPVPTISIHIDYDLQYAPLLFGILQGCRFAHVKSLWLRVNFPNLWANMDDFYPIFCDFYYGFISLEVLKTTTQGFSLLAMVSSSIDNNDYIPVPLPRLQRLRMISPSDENSIYNLNMLLEPEFITEFLELFKKRKLRGRPIKHFDIRGCEGDLRKLDQCQDLKVTWLDAYYRHAGQPGEYICGSGNREILNVES